MAMNRVWWLLVAFTSLSLFACIRLPENKPEKKRVMNVEINLPPRPNLSTSPTPEKYEDGSYTVEGFLRHSHDLVNKEVTLRGFVQSIDSCKDGERICRTVPHLVLVDELGKTRRRVFVVSIPADDVLEGYAVDSNQTLKGKVSLWSPDGRLIDLSGILVVPRKPETEESEKEEES